MLSLSLVCPDTQPRVGDRPYFGRGHSVAAAARRNCGRTHHLPAGELLGGVACSSCWEEAIRADERIVVECDLPREVEPDPDYLDEVAIRRAVRGEAVILTGAERREAIRRLSAAGLSKPQVWRRLRETTLDSVPADADSWAISDLAPVAVAA